MKSENDKKNHKNCQNQSPDERFSKSKDLIVQVVISWFSLGKMAFETLVKILAYSIS